MNPRQWIRRITTTLLVCGAILAVACEPNAPSCLSDSDCATGQQCLQGACKAANDTCRPGEKRGCYTGSADTRGKGSCRDGTQTCMPTGTWDPKCDGEILPKDEICDTQDNNCNGQIDDGVQGTEDCNGIDDDCDGKTDNVTNTDQPISRKCYGGPAGTEGKGPCRGGTQACENGIWSSTCIGEVQPATEVCNNNIDEDCNGKVDDVVVGEPCTDPSKKGECAKGKLACGSSGQKECVASTQPTAETCDGLDNDCDGGVDNVKGTQDPLPGQPCPYTGPPGTDGKGTCKPGTKACVNGQWSSTCVGEVQPATETCDGLDNDCDGTVDEGIAPRKCYSGPTGTEGKGTCKGGTQSCSAGKWGPCNGEVVPTAELCNNGQDEDCNGKVDDVSHLGAFCLDRSRKGVCQQGVYTCEGQKRVCKQRTQPSTETCDGNDNDCDGMIDNVKGKTDALTRPCYTGPAATRKKGTCKDGVQRCVLGLYQAHCEGETRPHPELCNQKDDDCDGNVDDDGACAACTNGATRPCFDGPLDARSRGSCRDGSETCVNKKWNGQCTGGQGPKAEICNGQDDNCDGLVDNQPNSQEQLRQPCFSGDAAKRGKGACRDGFQLCNAGQWTACAEEQLPITEICDNKDNNCDGAVDEGVTCQGKIRKLGESCSRSPDAPTSLQCEKGLMCVQADEKDPASFCYQVCKDSTECAKNQDGRTECVKLTETVGFCLSRGSNGGACDIERGRFCKTDLFCDMNVGRCRGPSVAEPLGQCGGRSGHICDGNHLCVPQTPGSPHGYCLPRCTKNGDCKSGICVYFSAQNAACAPLGTKKENEICGRGDLGRSLDTSRYCAKGLFCARFLPINPDGVCYKAVGNCTNCGSNQYCAAIGSGGLKVCAKTCGSCPTGQFCLSSNGAKFCAPDQPTGVVPFAGLCGPHRLCQKGLYCLSSDPQKFTGFCAKLGCTNNGDCPNVPPGAECRSIGTNLNACIFPCQTNANCPTGLACASNLKACFAP